MSYICIIAKGAMATTLDFFDTANLVEQYESKLRVCACTIAGIKIIWFETEEESYLAS